MLCNAQERPGLRIIDDELWRTVRQRINAPRRAGGRKGSGPQPKALFSGLLRCGCCGGAVVAVSARQYGCAARKDRGATVCAGVLAPRATVDSRLLAEVRDELLSPEALRTVQQQVRQIIAERQREAASVVNGSRVRLVALEQEIVRLVDAIAEIGISDALKTRLRAAEAERAQVLNAKAPNLKLLSNSSVVLARYHRLIGELETALARDSAKARTLLRDLLGQVRLTRSDDGIFAEY